MGGFLSPSSKIGGVETSPQPALASSPFSGLHQTPGGGIGASLNLKDHLLLDAQGFHLGRLDERDYVLSQAPGSPYTLGQTSISNSIAMSRDGKLVALIENTGTLLRLAIYLLDGTTGSLTPASGSPFNVLPRNSTTQIGRISLLWTANKLIVATDDVTGNSPVHVYNVNSATGVPTLLSSSFALGSRVFMVALSPDDLFIYGIRSGSDTVSVGSYNNVTGTIGVMAPSPSFGSVADLIDRISVTPDGNHVFVGSHTFGNERIIIFNRAVDGSLTINPSSPMPVNRPRDLIVTPDNRFVIVPNGGSLVYVFAISPGGLTPVAGSPFNSVYPGAFSGAVSPDGKKLVIGYEGSTNLMLFDIDEDGKLTPSVGAPYVTSNITRSAISPDNNSIIVGSAGNNKVYSFATNSSGMPSRLVDAQFDPGGSINGIFNVLGNLRELGKDVLTTDAIGNAVMPNVSPGSVGNVLTSTGAAWVSAAPLSGYTVGTLPAGAVGQRAYVTDALAPAYGAPVVGGGSAVIPVFHNGTGWIAA